MDRSLVYPEYRRGDRKGEFQFKVNIYFIFIYQQLLMVFIYTIAGYISGLKDIK